MPGREEGRRSSEDEQEQEKASQRLVLSFGMHLVKAEEQASQVKQRMSEKDLSSNFPGRRPMDEEEDVAVGHL